MGEPRIRVKINLMHDVRNHDANVSRIEQKIAQNHNHVNELVDDVRIAVGHSAGAIFLTLSDRRFAMDGVTAQYRISSIVHETIRILESYHYADNIRQDGNVLLEAVEVNDPDSHTFEVGDYALDSAEPTPSPEANTVRIVELIHARADEHMIEETGKTVAEHNPYHPNDDLVVAGVYPNMGSPDRVWHFPESRLVQ